MRKFLVFLFLFFILNNLNPASAQNYNATAGSGLVFGSKFVSSVNYPQFVMCDPTTPAQCVAVDSSGRMTLVPNQSVNIAQINGVTPLMGNGTTGTGSQRVTIASDNTAFTVNAAQSGTWNINNISGTISLPTGAATSANQPSNAVQGSTTSGQTGNLIQGAVTTAAPTYTTAQTNPLSLTTAGDLRTVFSNASLAVTQATSSNLKAQVDPLTAASWGLGATAAAVPANAHYVGMSQGGNLTGLTGTSGNLNVQCANCSGSGVSTADEATFTAGSSLFAGTGGFFQTTATNNALTTGQQGMWQMTANRAGFVNLRNASATEVGTSSNELFVGGRGTAGSAAGGVVTVQGVASMTPVLSNPGTAANWGVGTSTQNSSTVANGILALAQFNTTPTTITSGNMSPFQMDNAGNLLVNVKAGGGSGGTSSNFGSAFPTPGTAVGFSDGTNMVAAKVGAVANVTAATNMLNTLGIAQYNATPLTVTDTRYQSLQSDVNGFLRVNVMTATGLASGSTTSGQTGSMTMGAVTTANPSYTTAQTNYTSMDVKGNTRVVLGGGVPITASATGTTGATTATLATSASVTTYICGFSIRANATAVATGNATVTGTITGTMNFTQWTAANASGLGVTEETFTPCVPASAANTSIAVVSAAPGTGGVVSVSAWGYQQ